MYATIKDVTWIHSWGRILLVFEAGGITEFILVSLSTFIQDLWSLTTSTTLDVQITHCNITSSRCLQCFQLDVYIIDNLSSVFGSEEFLKKCKLVKSKEMSFILNRSRFNFKTVNIPRLFWPFLVSQVSISSFPYVTQLDHWSYRKKYNFDLILRNIDGN